jgi:carboxyl-terminal processing protease
LIRGKTGTKVNLTVLRQKGGNSETLHVALIRDKVDMSEQGARMVYQTPRVGDKSYKIAVIDLPSFYGSADKNGRDCYSDLKELVQQAASDKVDGMILDLSNNPGGLLNDAVKIAGLFIGTGSVVATQDASKNREVFADDDTQLVYSGPLLILTSRESASASEILAGALKDYHRALIVGGDHTYGKGSAQDLIPLPSDLGMMKLTTQLFFLPAGESTQYAGVQSDISLPTYSDLDEQGEKNMDYALPHTETERFISMQTAQSQNPEQNWNPINEGLVRYLKEKSLKRVENSGEFKDIQKDLNEFKKNKSWLRVANILKDANRDKQKRKERKEEAATAKGRQALWIKDPHMQESIHILEDWLSVSAAPLYAKNSVPTQPTARP